jgi:hypothetical protein
MLSLLPSLLSTLLLATGGAAPVPTPQATLADRHAKEIDQAARNYVEGVYTGDIDRIALAVHPSLQKTTVIKTPEGRELLMEMGRQSVMELARLALESNVEPKIEIELLGVYKGIAAVKIDSAKFLDYAHLIQTNKEWRIINMFGVTHSEKEQAAVSDADREAITKVAFEYADAFYTAEPERMGGTMHSRLQKVTVRGLSNGRDRLYFTNPDSERDRARNLPGNFPEPRRLIDVTLDSVFANTASVTIDSAFLVEYAHLIRINGEWKIINVVWETQKKRARMKR